MDNSLSIRSNMMRKINFTSILIAVVIGTTVITGTSMIQASESNTIDSHEVSTDSLPANLQYDSQHPDEIYIKDCGVFVKADSNPVDLHGKDVIYDAQEVTDKTEVIIGYDATYVKIRDWE